MRTQPEDIISTLEDHNSRINKEQILEAAMLEGLDEFFEGVKMALDKMYTFGVKQVPMATISGSGLPWNVFKELAEKLADRTLTGHAARDAIELAKNAATVKQWNCFYRRILIKDLKCGVSEKTVNKVAKKFPQYSVPVFSCQLAHDGANHEKKLVGEKFIEVKLDGIRVLTIVHPNGKVNMYSRNGKELTNFTRIAKWFEDKVTPHVVVPMVFDGEVMSSNFQDLMKQVYRKSDVQTDDAVLYLFDCITLADFTKGKSNAPQIERTSELYSFADFFNYEIIRTVEHERVNLDTDEGQQRLLEINKKAVDGGYEGIMIKDIDAPYECKRSHAWLKMKPFIEVSLEVVAVEEGTGRNEGRLGALVCEGIDDGRQIKVNVGSGLSDDDRIHYWESRQDVVGYIAEVRADAITQNQDGTYSLRFPRFKTFRGFDKGEKI